MFLPWLSLAGARARGVARNVEIDVSHKEEEDLLFISAMETGNMVPILSGDFPDDGGKVQVQIKYQDSYNQKYTEKLSIDFDNLSATKRKITYVISPLDEIVKKLERIKDELSDL